VRVPSALANLFRASGHAPTRAANHPGGTLTIEAGGKAIPVVFVHHARARKYVLRWTARGHGRVTIPRRGSLKQAVAFAQKHAAWLAAQAEKAGADWGEGTLIYWRGEAFPLRLVSVGDITGKFRADAGPHRIPLQPGRPVRRQVEEFLRAVAATELPRLVLEGAARHGLRVARVRIGNQGTRWGSCARSGAISLNWRLVQTPDFVRDYIIVHELMHLREMNHSDRFWGHVAVACPRYGEAEAWLRRHGRAIR
jgi:predicted metal-dependent hydrolase